MLDASTIYNDLSSFGGDKAKIQDYISKNGVTKEQFVAAKSYKPEAYQAKPSIGFNTGINIPQVGEFKVDVRNDPALTTGAKWLGNAASAGINMVTGLANAALNPGNTAEGIKKISIGAVDNANGENTPESEIFRKVATELSYHAYNGTNAPEGFTEEFGKQLLQNPGKVVADIGMLISGAGGAVKGAGKVAEVAGAARLAEGLGAAGEALGGIGAKAMLPVTLPITAPVNAAAGLIKHVGGFITGLGSKTMGTFLGQEGETALNAAKLGRSEGAAFATGEGSGIQKFQSQAAELESAAKKQTDLAYESNKANNQLVSDASKKSISDKLDNLSTDVKFDRATGQLVPTRSTLSRGEIANEMGGIDKLESVESQLAKLDRASKDSSTTVSHLNDIDRNLRSIKTEGIGSRIIGDTRSLFKDPATEMGVIGKAHSDFGAVKDIIEKVGAKSEDIGKAQSFIKKLGTNSAASNSARELAKEFRDMYAKYVGKDGFDFESYSRGLSASKLTRFNTIATSMTGMAGYASQAVAGPTILLMAAATSPALVSRLASALRLPLRMVNALVAGFGSKAKAAMEESMTAEGVAQKAAKYANPEEMKSASSRIADEELSLTQKGREAVSGKTGEKMSPEQAARTKAIYRKANELKMDEPSAPATNEPAPLDITEVDTTAQAKLRAMDEAKPAKTSDKPGKAVEVKLKKPEGMKTVKREKPQETPVEAQKKTVKKEMPMKEAKKTMPAKKKSIKKEVSKTEKKENPVEPTKTIVKTKESLKKDIANLDKSIMGASGTRKELLASARKKLQEQLTKLLSK